MFEKIEPYYLVGCDAVYCRSYSMTFRKTTLLPSSGSKRKPNKWPDGRSGQEENSDFLRNIYETFYQNARLHIIILFVVTAVRTSDPISIKYSDPILLMKRFG